MMTIDREIENKILENSIKQFKNSNARKQAAIMVRQFLAVCRVYGSAEADYSYAFCNGVLFSLVASGQMTQAQCERMSNGMLDYKINRNH